MNGPKNILSKIKLLKRKQEKGVAILVDPDKDNGDYFKALEKILPQAQPDLILVGGSFVKRGATDACIEKLKALTSLPIVLFPGHCDQLSGKADALLFLSLLSGRNPEFLVDQHVKSAEWLKKNDLEVIPTSYLIINDHQDASVLKASATAAIPPNDLKTITNTALAGFYMGHQLTYLDAGSGSKNPIPAKVLKVVSENVSLPLICGGGIRDAATAEMLFEAGADLLVIGNALEKDPYLLQSIVETAKNCSGQNNQKMKSV